MPTMDRQTDDHPTMTIPREPKGSTGSGPRSSETTNGAPRDPSRTLRAKRATLARRQARTAKFIAQGRMA